MNCEQCNGDGDLWEVSAHQTDEPCPRCGGTGKEPQGARFIAYITVYRGTGRPDMGRIKACESGDLWDADPMAAHDGAAVVGVFDSRADACQALNEFERQNTEVDGGGYTQWM